MRTSAFLCDLTHTHKTIALNCMPYPVACLATYAKSHLPNPDAFDFKIFKYPKKLADALIENCPPIIAFSNYMWNLDLSYSFVERIKRRNPKVIVIFGGPNYPTNAKEQEKFLKRYSLIDFYVYKEGEVGFTDLLKVLYKSEFDVALAQSQKPLGCHFMCDDKLVTGPPADRVKNLDEIPSPYLAGILDEFFEPGIEPMIQCNRGCPFACTFCVEGLSYYNKVNRRSAETIYKELQYIAEHKHHTIHALHIVDSNFGMYREDEAIGDTIAKIQQEFGWPEYIHVATGKNQKERVLRVAKNVNGALRLSGAVQSLSESVLENIKRSNIKADELMDLAQKARELGSNVYSESILAMPGDSKKTHFETNKILLDAGFQLIRNYPLMMLMGVEMSDEETRKKFEMKTGFRVMSQCFGVYPFGNEEPICSVETEEICTSTKDLSFEEYLEMRVFHLAIEVFYNDSMLLELLEFLKSKNVSASSLIFTIFERKSEFPKKLKQIFDDFRKGTVEELSDNENELTQRAKTPEAIAEYATGKHGSNMIYRFKALAFMEAVDEIINFSFEQALKLLVDSPVDKQYFEELRQYCLLKKNHFLETDRVFEETFHFDFPNAIPLPKGKKIKFFHDEAQKRMIHDNLGRYGKDSVGVARLLSKYNVTKMLRQVSE